MHSLDESTGASLKLSILNPKGRIWTMVAGGQMGLGQREGRWGGRVVCKRVVAVLCRNLFSAVLSPCLQAVRHPHPALEAPPPRPPPLRQAAARA